MRQSVSRGAVWCLAVLMFLAVSMAAAGQATPLPTPRQFVKDLDVRCYKIAKPLRLDHLNPLFIEKGLPYENVDLDRQQLCVPVRKNDEVPDPAALPFLKYVDWRCYDIDGPPLNLPLRVDHLNPVIAGMFGAWETITVQEPQQLCVPVAKDTLTPPPDILRLIQWLDVKCYRIDSDRWLGGEPIWLTHLNPLFWNIPPKELAYFVGPAPIQLCVPVAKNNTYPPADIRWVGSSRVDLQACKLEYSIVSPK